MIESLLNHGEEAKTSQLSMAMFYKDTAEKMNVVNPLAADDEANRGLKARYEFTKYSHTVDMMGPIHSDIFFQDRLMLNGVDLRIKLNRAKMCFVLCPQQPELITKWLSQKRSCLYVESRLPLVSF